MSGWNKRNYQLDMVVSHHASEKKLELMEKILGVFSESINLKKLNNLLLPVQKIHGKSMKK